MLLSPKIRIVLGWLAGIGLATGAWTGGKLALLGDPFAGYRPKPNALGGDIGIQLKDVRFRHYSGKDLVAEGNVGQVNVRKDRQNLEFLNIKNGVYRANKGTIHYQADAGSYESVVQMLTVNTGAKVWNKDISLVAPTLIYDARKHRLQAKGTTVGRFFGGNVTAKGVEYNLEENTYSIGPATWVGYARNALQDTPIESKSEWRFKTDGLTSVKNGIETWNNAEATDGDIIVKAPKIVRDTKTDAVTATGPVYYYSADANLVCDKCFIYRKEKRAVLVGNVRMLIKPDSQPQVEVVEIPPFRPMVPDEVSKTRPPAPPVESPNKELDNEVNSPKTRRKYPIVILAAKIEYWYKKGARRAIISGSPQARQELQGGRWRAVWTTTAYYDGEKELLKLASVEGKKTTRVKTSTGNDIQCNWLELSTKDDDDSWSAFGAVGVLKPDDDDEIPPTQGKAPPPLSGRIGT